jgi:uncharacterized membrane protein YjgN (DUF898 family)
MNDASPSFDSIPRGETLRIDYVPRDGLLKLSLVNFLLGIVTLTIYRFWARTNVRRHIWSCVHINGQPLEYTGKGGELFKGALIVFAVLGLPVILAVSAISIAYGPEHPAVAGIQTLVFLIVSILWGAALFRARRYQLSRTLWRGIRGGLEGSATTYSLTYFGALLARAMTLGWTTPVMNLNLQQQMTGATRFGDMPFSFKGRAGPLYPTYALCWFMTLGVIIGAVVVFFAGLEPLFSGPLSEWLNQVFIDDAPAPENAWMTVAIVIGGLFAMFLAFSAIYPVIWAFYTARELSVFAAYTTLDQARFRLDATAGSIIALTIGNLLLWIVTLGIATPYIQQRLIRYICDRITVEGEVDVDRILQSRAPLSTTGEGLADALDIGGI